MYAQPATFPSLDYIFCSVDPFGLRRKMFVKILGRTVNLPTKAGEEEERLIDENENEERFQMNIV